MFRIQKFSRMALLLCLLVGAHAAQAQFREVKKGKSKDNVPFKDKLWYGGGLNIGFNQLFDYNTGGSVSVFGFGVSPMVGYKFYGPFSAGPRTSIFFSTYKQAGSKAVGLFNFELGLFLRARVFRGFFLQGEVSNEWQQNLYYNPNNGETFKQYDPYSNQYLGAGYNFSGGEGGGGSEISIMYNFALANDLETSRLPIDYRFAFTWNF